MDNTPNFDNASLFTTLDENSIGGFNYGGDSANDASGWENSSARDQESSIDPALPREGRGKTP